FNGPYGSSSLVQALAVLALADTTHAGNAPDAAAVSFLAGQQCANGSFQVATRTGGSCSGFDTDTTAYAIQALIAAGDHPAASRALGWLARAQHRNGGWSESGGSPNANSTAIAVEAQVAAHDSVRK